MPVFIVHKRDPLQAGVKLARMKRPNILVLAGHDPSGGAGIQADIESVAANGAHAATVITLLTCQDTVNVHSVQPVALDFFRRCLDAVLADMRFDAIKVGVVANPDQVTLIADLARSLPQVPLVVDPVLRAAGGGQLADDAVGLALREQLFELADVVTPNADEARLLCDGEPDLQTCGERLSNWARSALITGGDESDEGGENEVVNQLFIDGSRVASTGWPRLPGVFHGSGCTLASAVAAQLAHGVEREAALQAAQSYVWQTLDQAFAAGQGQRIPARMQAMTGTVR